jgi:hypothetical protein
MMHSEKAKAPSVLMKLSSILTVKIFDVVAVELSASGMLIQCPFVVVKIDLTVFEKLPNLSADPQGELGTTPLRKLNCNVGVRKRSLLYKGLRVLPQI